MKKLTRREFIKTSAAIAAMAVLPKSIFGTEKTEIEGPAIGIARGEKTKLVKAAVDAIGGIDEFISKGDNVLIKPNISFATNPEIGANTSPGVIKQVVQLCLDAGAAKVVLADYPLANVRMCLEKSGVQEAVIDEDRVSIIMLGKERQFVEVEVPGGKELKQVKIARELAKADKFINLPTAKTHSATGISLGFKNLMGLIWDRGYLHQVDINRAIAELGLVIKPDLTIVDATRVLVRGGPGGPGKTVILNTVIAGTDMVAVDSYTVGISQWYGKSFTGESVKSIVAAYDLGLGEIDTAKMKINEVAV